VLFTVYSVLYSVCYTLYTVYYVLFTIVTGNNSSLPTENNSTELTCNVDTDFAITSLHWRRNEDIINGTSDEYSVTTPTNKHSTLTLNKPGRLSLCTLGL